MGSSAPWPATVRRTLLRLVEGDEVEDVAASRRGGKGRPRTLSEVDDLYIDLLACDGLSQRAVTEIVNVERQELGLKPVDCKQIREAEKRVDKGTEHVWGVRGYSGAWVFKFRSLCDDNPTFLNTHLPNLSHLSPQARAGGVSSRGKRRNELVSRRAAMAAASALRITAVTSSMLI